MQGGSINFKIQIFLTNKIQQKHIVSSFLSKIISKVKIAHFL